MKSAPIFYFVAIYSGYLINIGCAFFPSDLYCEGIAVHDLRIEGCSEPPCKIKKGDFVNYEIDFRLENPGESADVLRSNVFVSYYSIPPPAYGSYFSDASCEYGNVGLECPVKSNVNYTIKTPMFIAPQAECHFDCDGMGPDGTGLRDTMWAFGSNKEVCIFSVLLNITE